MATEKMPVGFTWSFRRAVRGEARLQGMKVLVSGRKWRPSPRTAVQPPNFSKKRKEKQGA